MKNPTAALLIAAALGCSAVPGPVEPADLIVHHAKIVTVDASLSIAEAMAVRGGRVVALGPDEEIFRLRGPSTRVLDADGHTVLPGLYDSHVHLLGASTSEHDAPLPRLKTLQDAFDHIRARAAAAKPGEWIVLRYAFPTRLKDARFPTRAELDAAAPNHPVLYHAGPAGMVNSKALEISGITRDTASGPDTTVVKDPKTGEPTGMLRGRKAYGLLKGVPGTVTAPPEAQVEAIRKLLALYNARGITSVADRNTDEAALTHLRELEKSGALTCRVNVAPAFDPTGTPEEIGAKLDRLWGPSGAGTDWLRVGPIKLFLDGGMLNGTAYMREPWPKGPTYQIVEDGYHGHLFIPPDRLRMVLGLAARRGWQMTAHTAGEGAMDVLLDAYEAVNRETPIRDLRWCITHANFPSARNLGRCRALNVGADVQPAWLYKDGTTLLEVLGPERIRWFQPFKTWLKHTTIGGGSDHMIKTDPLEATNPWDPWLAMWVTLTRKTEGGAVPNPEECLTREEALRLYTINNAWLNREETSKGSLEVGKLADFILIDRDYLTCPVDEVRRIQVFATFVGGRQVYPAER